jgi:hypothetical protein
MDSMLTSLTGRDLARQAALVIFLSDNGGSASDPSTAPKTVEGLLGENGAGKDGYWAGIGWSNTSNTPFRRYKCDMTGGGTELHNLANEQPELVATLQKQWEDWYAKVPKKRFTQSIGEPRYRRIDDPEETYNRRVGDEIKIVRRSEGENEKLKKGKPGRPKKGN